MILRSLASFFFLVLFVFVCFAFSVPYLEFTTTYLENKSTKQKSQSTAFKCQPKENNFIFSNYCNNKGNL